MFLPFQGKPGLPGPVGLHGVPGLPGPRGEKVGYFPNPSAQGESERNIRVDLWEGILGSADIPGVYWLCSEPNVSRGNFSPPALLRLWSRNLGRMGALGSAFLRMLCFPCREWRELAFPAPLARREKKESRWVGNFAVRFALKSSWSVHCLQILLQYLGFPWNPVVSDGKGERREDLGFKIGAFTVSSVVFRE